MSANTVVDIGNTCQTLPSVMSSPFLSGGLVAVGSGTIIGNIVDMRDSDTYCNLYATGFSFSGQLRLQVQVSDSTTSGSFFDPTSGLADFPGSFQSGGVLWINSGGTGNGLLNAFVSGQCVASGFFVAQGFVRIGEFARVNVLSEANAQYGGPLVAGFISNLRTIGSGGGFTWSPSSGTAVNV